MLQIEQKMCKGTQNVPVSLNEVHEVPIAMGAKWLLWYLIAVFALYGLMWPRMVLIFLFTALQYVVSFE